MRVELELKDLPGVQHRPQQNAILGALSSAECDRLANDLELVSLALGQVLYDSGQIMSHAYFPIDCIVSILYVMKNGQSAEIAIVGNEGVVGIALFMGGESTQSRAVVQNAGHAYRLKAQVLKDEFHSGGALQRLLLMFASALITQMVQTAACNRHHPVDQQLCRWMLLSLDRLPSNQIRMNDKLIGNMLGLTPENVTKATSLLQKAGLIHYDAGEITVLDRRAVEKRSCECYAVVKRESDRLLETPGSRSFSDQPQTRLLLYRKTQQPRIASSRSRAQPTVTSRRQDQARNTSRKVGSIPGAKGRERAGERPR